MDIVILLLHTLNTSNHNLLQVVVQARWCRIN